MKRLRTTALLTACLLIALSKIATLEGTATPLR